MMHFLPMLIENSIGKARQILKLNNKTVPVSAYGLFIELKREGHIQENELEQWKKVIGLRNTIVHEYMKVNISLLKNIVKITNICFFMNF